jgi:hypothetical protein
MTYFGTCEACSEPVVGFSGSERGPAFPVEGWEVPREQGGTNHVRNRRRVPGRVRHVGCLPGDDAAQEQMAL